MYARIERDFEFQAGIHFEQNFIINSYNLQLQMGVMTEDLHEQNIAFERIKYLIEYSLENSLFIDYREKSAIDLYSKAGIKLCILPDEPFDQIVAAVLLSKINAITEKKLFLVEMRILSKISDGVSFYLSHDEVDTFTKSEDVWYTENSASINNNKKINKKEKIVELKKESNDWNSIGLGWKSIDTDKTGSKIVFTSQDK
jgi:hypothetical protein